MKSVNAYVEFLVSKNPSQIISVYDARNNLLYHGKCDYAPLNLYYFIDEVQEFKGIDIDGNVFSEIAIFCKKF